MITSLGNVEGGPKPRKPTKSVDGSLYRAKVIAPGTRWGQVVDVLSESRGEAVCVFEGNRFKLSVDSLQRVLRRTSRKRKKSK